MTLTKRSFILIEIVIAITLLSTCAIPLIGSSMLAFKKRKNQLIELELERRAELLFYHFLKETLPSVHFEEISNNKEPKEFKPFVLLIDHQKLSFHSHYHLFHAHQETPKETLRAKCKICISREKGKCSDPFYQFEFFAKKVAEKSVDPHVGNKEKTLEKHERLPSELQTLRPGERESS